MPLSFVQIVLGASFVLIWVFIATMVLRDGRFAIHDEQESETFRAHPRHTSPPPPHTKLGGREPRGQRRRASTA